MPGILKSGSARTKTSLSDKRVAIVVASWNEEITEALYEGAVHALVENGIRKNNITRKKRSGKFRAVAGCAVDGRKEKHRCSHLSRLCNPGRHSAL